ncbi:MAG: ParB/RepB/Spo0J family partition protein [Flavobacteriales bacterium]|nr:ParB/RepB/Spo0J family partition protein [Flavobacteriales bacterium]
MSNKVKSKGGLGRGINDIQDYRDFSLGMKSKLSEITREPDLEKEPVKQDKSVKPRYIGQMAGNIAMIPIGNIQRNKTQPRESFDEKTLKSLQDSIKELGIIQPITVRKISALKYQIISGERRFRAAQAAGLDEIPSYIRKADDKQLLEMALVENVQRQDLHPIEISTSYKRLIEECELTHEQISKIVGQSRSSITNSLRLLDLPEEIKIELAKRTLSKGHAKALLSISSNPERQILIMNLAITQKFSVRETEALCQKDGGKSRLQKKSIHRFRDLCEDEIQALDGLRLRFGAKIKLKPITGEKFDTSGRIELHYNNIEDLEKLLDKLKR